MLRHLLLRTLVCLLTLWLALDDQRACGQSHSPPASGCPARCGSPESGLAVNKKQTKTKQKNRGHKRLKLSFLRRMYLSSRVNLAWIMFHGYLLTLKALNYYIVNKTSINFSFVFIVVLNIPITCLCGPLSELLFSNNCNRLYLPNTGNYSFGQEM